MLTLRNRILIQEIKKKSQAKAFANVEVGDILDIAIDVRNPGRGSCGAYAPKCSVTNFHKGTIGKTTLARLSNTLNCYKYQEALG